MSLEKPSPEVVRASRCRLPMVSGREADGHPPDGPRRRQGDRGRSGRAAAVARFYEIGTNRPIFSGRDGVIKYDVAQIEAERRNGYAWYGSWGDGVLKDWAKWKARR